MNDKMYWRNSRMKFVFIQDDASSLEEYAKSKNRQKITEDLIFSIQKFKPFEDFSLKSQEIIKTQLLAEGEERVEDYLFQFLECYPDILPVSYWEEKEPGLKDIMRLEKVITEQGFDSKFPILLTAWDEKRVVVDGGHHRLQAVRNLINEAKLPKRFQVPCLLRALKKNFNYKKKNLPFPIEDYHYILDLLKSTHQNQDQLIYIVIEKNTIWLWLKYVNESDTLYITHLIHLHQLLDLKPELVSILIKFLQSKYPNIKIVSQIKQDDLEIYHFLKEYGIGI